MVLLNGNCRRPAIADLRTDPPNFPAYSFAFWKNGLLADDSEVFNKVDHDLSRVLMAICNLQGIWDRQMRIPEPSRTLLVKQELGKWKLDERGYPVPSNELIEECERLRDRERQREKATPNYSGRE